MKKLLFTILFTALAIGIYAQTNGLPPMPPIPVVVTNVPPDVSTAIANLVHAIFPKFSVGEIVEVLGAIFLLARTLRKLVPDSMQTGKLGQLLRHSSLEINPPTQEMLKANPNENAAPYAPPVVEPPKV